MQQIKILPNLSAGVPLTYRCGGNSATSVKCLTTSFLENQFVADKNDTFRKNGFSSYITLKEIFANKYTCLSGEKIQVRSIKAEDIYNITGLTEMKLGSSMNVNNAKYNQLLVNGANYFLGSPYYSYALWGIDPAGRDIGGYNYRPVVSLNSAVKAKNKDKIEAWNIEI